MLQIISFLVGLLLTGATYGPIQSTRLATSNGIYHQSQRPPLPRIQASIAKPANTLAYTGLPAYLTYPVRLQIPKIAVDAAIEYVGQDVNGAMETPALMDNVAWYKPSAAPGEIGNAVISGHLDRANGTPAVFWRIQELSPGDELIVSTRDGRQHHFVVTYQSVYDYDRAPLEEIFGFTLHSQLNLITCNGKWDSRAQNYTKRLVVYASLIQPDKGSR